MAAAWDQIASLTVMSPAAAAAEDAAGAWLKELLGLPGEASFGFATGAQMANFTALAAARHHVLEQVGWDVERLGLTAAPPIQVVMGAESHATVAQALVYLGLGAPERAAADDQGRMLPGSLRDVLSRTTGPAIVCAQAGNVDSGSFDPFDEVADVCAERGAWLHVDGAFGLWAAASPTVRYLCRGVDRADSWATDCHKWLNVPYDSAFVACRHEASHRAAMTWRAPYVEPEAGREPYQFVPEASRRARGFAVWAAVRELGSDGVAAMIDRSCANARYFAELLAAEPGFTILNDVVLNQVVVRVDDSDAVTAAVTRRVQDEGTTWFSGTRWRGLGAFRLSVSNWATTRVDIERSAAAIVRGARDVRADSSLPSQTGQTAD